MNIKKINEIKKRQLIEKYEYNSKILKVLESSLSNQSKKRAVYSINLVLHFLSRTTTRINHRCRLTNRNRGVFRSYGLSRLQLRKLMQFGLVPGYKKAVW